MRQINKSLFVGLIGLLIMGAAHSGDSLERFTDVDFAKSRSDCMIGLSRLNAKHEVVSNFLDLSTLTKRVPIREQGKMVAMGLYFQQEYQTAYSELAIDGAQKGEEFEMAVAKKMGACMMGVSLDKIN